MFILLAHVFTFYALFSGFTETKLLAAIQFIILYAFTAIRFPLIGSSWMSRPKIVLLVLLRSSWLGRSFFTRRLTISSLEPPIGHHRSGLLGCLFISAIYRFKLYNYSFIKQKILDYFRWTSAVPAYRCKVILSKINTNGQRVCRDVCLLVESH